jgi:hypothetical protein
VRITLLLTISAGLAGLGCEPPPVDTDPLSHLPRFEEQRQILCARGRSNSITDALCSDDAPNISSLRELQEAIGMGFIDGQPLPNFSLTANSTSLSTRTVSSINPRAVFVKPPALTGDGSFKSLAFVRGDHAVEMAVKTADGDFALYLLRYERACGDDCTFAERLTPATERDWTRWSLYDDVDLKNSVFDCLVCHQPGGVNAPVMFRMQEFRNPWTHWMAAFGEGERVLLTDYGRAHGPDEEYAGIPPSLFVQSNPIPVENFFKDSGGVEPNEFPSETIEEEIKATNPAQPDDNSTPGISPTWEGLYDRAVRGEVGPPPYHDVKITDVDKLAAMTEAYRAFMAGDSDDLPDIRDVIRDDALSKMSVRPKPGLSGAEIVVHMCAQCHNSRLDAELSRARFDATRLDEMPRDVKDAAIARVQLTREDRFKMPPTFLRELSDEEIELVVQALRR